MRLTVLSLFLATSSAFQNQILNPSKTLRTVSAELLWQGRANVFMLSVGL